MPDQNFPETLQNCWYRTCCSSRPPSQKQQISWSSNESTPVWVSRMPASVHTASWQMSGTPQGTCSPFRLCLCRHAPCPQSLQFVFAVSSKLVDAGWRWARPQIWFTNGREALSWDLVPIRNTLVRLLWFSCLSLIEYRSLFWSVVGASKGQTVAQWSCLVKAWDSLTLCWWRARRLVLIGKRRNFSGRRFGHLSRTLAVRSGHSRVAPFGQGTLRMPSQQSYAGGKVWWPYVLPRFFC